MEEILIQIYEWFFGNPYGVTMAEPLVCRSVGAIVSGLGALFGGGAKKRAIELLEKRKD